MWLATICAKYFHKMGKLIVVSDEINACTIKIDAEFDGKEPWYLLFKNETHNHPTEIEPFGGASTCLGGAIREPVIWAFVCVSGDASFGSGRCIRAYEETRSKLSCLKNN